MKRRDKMSDNKIKMKFKKGYFELRLSDMSFTSFITSSDD